MSGTTRMMMKMKMTKTEMEDVKMALIYRMEYHIEEGTEKYNRVYALCRKVSKELDKVTA